MLYNELVGSYYITRLFFHFKQCCIYEMLVDQMPIRVPFFMMNRSPRRKYVRLN